MKGSGARIRRVTKTRSRRRDGNRLCVRCGRRRTRHGKPGDLCSAFRGQFVHEREQVRRGILQHLRRRAAEAAKPKPAPKPEKKRKGLVGRLRNMFS